MSGLVLKLAPQERVLVNGAVIENGPKRGRVVVLSRGANILRLRDAIHPQEANTPVKRACYALQLVLSGDVSAEEAHLPMLRRLEELSQVFTDRDSRRELARASDELIGKQHYHCLKSLRGLLSREARLLAAQP